MGADDQAKNPTAGNAQEAQVAQARPIALSKKYADRATEVQLLVGVKDHRSRVVQEDILNTCSLAAQQN